jgi:hypothetical protein
MSEAPFAVAIQEWAAARRLPEVHLARWLGLATGDRSALFDLARSLNLRTGQFVAIFTLLEEIGVREDQSIETILKRPRLRQIFVGNDSAPGKARVLLETLRTMRFPLLHATRERLSARLKGLSLPPGVRAALPSDLSSAELRLELAAHSGPGLRQLLEALMAHSDELCEIADQLGGTHEV